MQKASTSGPQLSHKKKILLSKVLPTVLDTLVPILVYQVYCIKDYLLPILIKKKKHHHHSAKRNFTNIIILITTLHIIMIASSIFNVISTRQNKYLFYCYYNTITNIYNKYGIHYIQYNIFNKIMNIIYAKQFSAYYSTYIIPNSVFFSR